jgi:predicted ferric reductase
MPVFVYDFGRLCALVVFVLIFFQYLLSARIKWIEKGIGLDRMLMIHKRSGLIVLCLIFGHPLLMNLSERLAGLFQSFSCLQAPWACDPSGPCFSAGAALLYERLRLKYETWKSLHKAGYALYPLAFATAFS